ncbi:MAG: CDP-alcohol phosphatidyltransferase family protein [Chthoniobacterales bacterium]
MHSPPVVISAEPPAPSTEICGVSLLDRLLRILQRLGYRTVTIVSSKPAAIEEHLGRPSWARSEIAVTVKQQSGDTFSADVVGTRHPQVVVVSANFYHDPRLLKTLMQQPGTALLIDSAAPAPAPPSREFATCGAAILSKDWLTGRSSPRPLFEELAVAAQSGEIATIDVQKQPTYVVDMRRHIRPLWFAAPGPEHLSQCERALLDAAQNGTLDLPAKLHAPIETWIISHLCRTPVTPLQITLFTAAVSASVTWLFASGALAIATILALLVGVLDGLDGKQARVKVETTELGRREHILDYVLELSWWTALSWRFAESGQLPHAYGLLVLLLASDLFDRWAKKLAKQHTGRNLDDLAPFDRFVRLIGGRRNIYVWILAAGLMLGRPDKAFLALCVWGAATAAVHVMRALCIARS